MISLLLNPHSGQNFAEIGICAPQDAHTFVSALWIGFPTVCSIDAPIFMAAPHPKPPAANAPATPLLLFAAPSYTSKEKGMNGFGFYGSDADTGD